MSIISAAIPGIIGGAFSSFGQSSANKANKKLAREQMRFQERMSSTAYQRSAADLEKAGLNRILALGSPASSPAGARAQMGNVGAGIAEGLKSGTASALQKRQQDQQLRAIESGIEVNQATVAEKDQLIKESIQRERQHSANARIGEMEAETREAMGVTGRILHQFLPGISALLGVGVGGATGYAAGKARRSTPQAMRGGKTEGTRRVIEPGPAVDKSPWQGKSTKEKLIERASKRAKKQKRGPDGRFIRQ